MARVDSNSIGLTFAPEASDAIEMKTKAPATATWRSAEPNTINQFGATLTFTPREPLSPERQRRKGKATDADAATGWEEDLTYEALRNWIGPFCFADRFNSDISDLTINAISTSTITLSSTADEKAVANTLWWVRGATNSANNGLVVVSSKSAAVLTIGVTRTLVAQDSAGGKLDFAGVRVPAASGRTWVYNATTKRGTLTATNIGVANGAVQRTFKKGQMVHIGSIETPGSSSTIVNRLTASEGSGFARIREITTNTIVFDRLSGAAGKELKKSYDATAIGSSVVIDLVSGEFVRNVSATSPEFDQRTWTIEGVLPDLIGEGMTGYEYSRGNTPNTLALNFPLTDKATMSLGFVSADSDKPTGTRIPTTANVVKPSRVEAISTATDFARLRVEDVDDDGLMTDFKSVTFNINNNVTPDKLVGELGAGGFNRGTLQISIDAQTIFDDEDVIDAIKQNTTIQLEVIIGNDDGVMAFDLPTATLGGGGREYPANESVRINTTVEAFGDPNDLDTSIGVTLIPVPLPLT